MMMMVAGVDGEDGSYITFPTPSVSTHSVPHLMFRFLTELRRDYFSSCTLVLLHDSPHSPPNPSAGRSSHPGREMMALVDLILKQDTAASHLVFILNDSLPLALHQVDLSGITRCPVYVSVTWAVGGLLWVLREPLWDWDKYLASRKHVIFNFGPADLTAEALQGGELNTFTNLVAVQAVDTTSLSVTTNTPYHWPRLRALMTWRDERLATDTNVFRDKLSDLRGHQMRVVTFHFPPRIFMEEDEDRASPVMYGVDIELCGFAGSSSHKRRYSRTAKEEVGAASGQVGCGWDCLALLGSQLKVVMNLEEMRYFSFSSPLASRVLRSSGVLASSGWWALKVVRALTEALNFTVDFRRPSDGEMWGWEQDNGSWTGLMGDLQRRKADIGVADLYIMEHYFTIIDMSVGGG
ncbi:hypothetical protein O3P69_009203 [Scylla paramamosain]|uniref:Ionotropic glutamate receptor L-glutamate and glycine-binding domain-containing protein n=1 Tax=Scylla paramamosain TaxID=85552 RepID=A0AAW0TAQ7_SCYPA